MEEAALVAVGAVPRDLERFVRACLVKRVLRDYSQLLGTVRELALGSIGAAAGTQELFAYLSLVEHVLGERWVDFVGRSQQGGIVVAKEVPQKIKVSNERLRGCSARATGSVRVKSTVHIVRAIDQQSRVALS